MNETELAIQESKEEFLRYYRRERRKQEIAIVLAVASVLFSLWVLL